MISKERYMYFSLFAIHDLPWVIRAGTTEPVPQETVIFSQWKYGVNGKNVLSKALTELHIDEITALSPGR
jgi:hypothetical protein